MSFRGLTVFLGIASGVAVMQPPETFSDNVLPANQQAERNGASTMPANDNRYQGKPLLRLLELYVIWSIGELSEADAS